MIFIASYFVSFFFLIGFKMFSNEKAEFSNNSSVQYPPDYSSSDVSLSEYLLHIRGIHKIQKFLENELFYKANLSINAGQSYLTLNFNFSLELLNLLDKLEINKIKVHLNSEVTSLNTSLTNDNVLNESSTVCGHQKQKYSVVKFCYYNSTISTIEIRSVLNLLVETRVICIKFLNYEDDFELFANNMCFDTGMLGHHLNLFAEVEPTFKYKPLFIVLMYMVCASILIPVIIWQHFITKAKEKRMAIMKRKMKDSDRKNPLTRDFLMPLLFKYEAHSMENFLTPIGEEAIHILNDKPWARSDSALSNVSSSNVECVKYADDHLGSNFDLYKNGSILEVDEETQVEEAHHDDKYDDDDNISTRSIGFSNEDVQTIKLISHSSDNLNVMPKSFQLKLNEIDLNCGGNVLYESNV